MAEKRMYSKKITDGDDFIQMPASSQALYFHLNQCADDDGFNNQIQIAMLKAHASIDDLKVLMSKNFIIQTLWENSQAQISIIKFFKTISTNFYRTN